MACQKGRTLETNCLHQRLMRLFVSIPLPENVIDELTQLQKKLCSLELFEGKGVPPENLHITLAFLGSVEEDELPIITNQLAMIGLSSFEIELRSLEYKPQIIWVTVNAPALKNLAQEVQDSLQYKEERPFSGHITLMRLKKVFDKEAFKKNLQEIAVKPLSWHVNSFNLMESITLNEGSLYKTLATYLLID